MNGTRLSVCIPTYNFGRFIGRTLESVLPQATGGVEVLVVDGASTDDTREVVGRFQALHPHLRYVRLDRRGGIDRDMAASVELAAGEYVWLFSADDVVADGAVGRLLGKIGPEVDVHVCGFQRCTFDLVPIGQHPILDHAGDGDFALSDPEARADYFRRARTTTAFFSFMSSLVVNRARWIEAGQDESFVGSCWAHVARIFRLIPSGLRVRYLDGAYLLNRGGNDSFLEQGLVHRIGIAVDGFHRLGDAYFGRNSPEAFHMRRAVRNEYDLRYLLYAKLQASRSTPPETARLSDLVARLCADRHPGDRLRETAWRMAPVPLLRIAERASRAIRRTAA